MTDRIPLNDMTSDQLDALYQRAETAEKRLRLAHQARRAKEHQLDGIRRALCDVGLIQDDDPYSHADLEDVIRQAGRLDETKAAVTADLDDEPAPAEPVVDRQTAVVLAALHRSAGATVTRVIDLYERWVKAGPPPLGTSVSRWWDARLVELHDTIQPPEPTTPFVDRPFRSHQPNTTKEN